MSYLSYLLSNYNNPIDHCDHIDELDYGVLKVRAQRPSHSGAIISCGIHGNETAPIEIINDIVFDIIQRHLTPQINLLIIFGHVNAMKAQSRFLDFNLNRLFNQNWKNYPHAQESKRAQQLEKHVKEFSRENIKALIHLDLHTALAKSKHERFAILPKKKRAPYTQEHFKSLSSLGLDALVLQSFESTTFSAFTEEIIGDCGLSATVELGKVMPFGQNNQHHFLAAENSLRTLISCGRLPIKEIPKCYQVKRALIKDFEGYKLCLGSSDINFTKLTAGSLLEEKENEKVYANADEYIIFPNQNVKVGQRSGLILSSVNQYND